MMRTSRRRVGQWAFVLFGAAALAGIASADPTLTQIGPADAIAVGGGLEAYAIRLFPDDALNSAISVRLTLTGAIEQLDLVDANAIATIGQVEVDLESERQVAAPLDPAYDPARDSRFDDTVLPQSLPPFFGAMGGESGSGTFSFSAGSGPGSQVDGQTAFDLGYVVVPVGSSLSFDLFVARGGEGFSSTGVIGGGATAVPMVGGLAGWFALLSGGVWIGRKHLPE